MYRYTVFPSIFLQDDKLQWSERKLCIAKDNNFSLAGSAKQNVTYFHPKFHSSFSKPYFLAHKRVTRSPLLNINVTVFLNCPEYCKVMD